MEKSHSLATWIVPQRRECEYHGHYDIGSDDERGDQDEYSAEYNRFTPAAISM